MTSGTAGFRISYPAVVMSTCIQIEPSLIAPGPNCVVLHNIKEVFIYDMNALFESAMRNDHTRSMSDSASVTGPDLQGL